LPSHIWWVGHSVFLQLVYFPSGYSRCSQGSILGPLLYSFFINDISNSIRFSKFHIYADDVQIYLSGSKESIASVINQINADLASISDWSTQNGLYLNSQKTQAMAIFRNSHSPLPPAGKDWRNHYSVFHQS
jgi:Reverse transcriptase (RNA-dependent DNA polymerase)